MNTQKLIAGVDEAGRGPLVGNVVAAAVILNPNSMIPELDDSKKLSEKKRIFLSTEIKTKAFCWSIGQASPDEIDRLNILQASLLAMQRAVLNLKHIPEKVLVDGNAVPRLNIETDAIIGGDGKIPSISAASIIAKVTRDQQMKILDAEYPEYGFAKHKGYPTKKHIEALKKFGVLKDYRKTFKPVKNILNN
ncbi:ribonuclease HII [Paraphotobacterium marinum]|uniref:Ribonuclease HII n=1 Tax=Paraphotobacterium marinum TaxID=1755811 RepID=A0A220VC02_9GAMM|nr:ribonuclease HII [Paraphotobacterium marinum]ASK77811.1 ribonuclease HII [Paraphotobacterium marinum]